MTRGVLGVSLAALTAAAGVVGVLAAAPQEPFRASVDVVSLNVTVADGTGRYVTDLEANDFQVYEDGVRQTVTSCLTPSS